MTSATQHRTSSVRFPRAFARDCDGATAIEYALIAAGIAMAIAVIVPQVGVTVAGLYTTIAGSF